MALNFSHAVGYHGLAAFGKWNGTAAGDFKMLLATGGQISVNYDPINSGAVWGANAKLAMQIAYAKNYPRLEGNVSFELNTVYPSPRISEDGDGAVLLFPDGTHGFMGRAWGNSFSVECSEGSALTSQQGFIGDPSGDNLTAGTAVDSYWRDTARTHGIEDPGPDFFAGATLIPYYCAFARGFESSIEVISWNYNASRDLQLLKLCKGESQVPLAADYIVQGEKTVDGSITVFQIPEEFKKNFSASPTFGYYNSIGDAPTETLYSVPNAYFTSKSTSLTTGAGYIQCDFNFTGYGTMYDESNSGSGSGTI